MKKVVLTDEDLRQVARIVENMIYLDNAATTFPKPEKRHEKNGRNIPFHGCLARQG